MRNYIKKVSLRFEKHCQKYPKNDEKTAIFEFFLNFSKTVHVIRPNISTVIQHHVRVLYVDLYVEFYQNRRTGIGASQKEKDLSRLSSFTAHAAAMV